LYFGKKSSALSTLFIVIIILIVAVIAVAAVVVVLYWPSGLVIGSSNPITEEMDLSDFTIVEVGWGFEVEITQSSSYSINITAEDNLFDYILVSKTGDTLTIGLKWGYSYQFLTLRTEITMPDLYELEFSGGTQGTIEGFGSSHDFIVELSGGSSLSGIFTTSEDAQFTLSGGSHLTELDGAANDLFISASGGSVLELSDFLVHDADIEFSGGSQGTINLNGRLDADVSGGSHLLYIGEPTMGDIQESGGSTVGPVT